MKLKSLVWVSSSKKDLSKFPEDVEDAIGYARYYAQKGIMHKDAKALKGFGSADVIEIIEMDESGTYRAVYTVQMQGYVFVLHVFQKKSKQGIKTPKPEIDLINNRIKQAKEMYKELLNKK
jgi:phage-related protein